MLVIGNVKEKLYEKNERHLKPKPQEKTDVFI